MVVRNARLMDLNAKANLTFWSYSEPLRELKKKKKIERWCLSHQVKGVLQLHPESAPACHCPVWQSPLALELQQRAQRPWNGDL